VPATGSVLQGDAAALGVDGGSGASAAGTPGTEGAAGEGLPEDTDAAQAQRLTTLEGELSQMRAEQERLRLALETMNTQLAEARSQTTSNAVVYGLATLVLLLLGVLVWLLRSRSAALNSAGLGAGVGTGFGATRLPSSLDNAAAGAAVEPTPDGATPAGSAPWWADSTHAPVKASGFTAVEVDEHPQEPDAAPASGFAHSQIEPNSLPLAAQDLADLVRQVEFFEVLGQGNEAIEALQAFIKTHPAQSELPYLLLMQLAVRHNTGQLPDLQRQYMRHFDLPAPQQQECAPDAPGLLEDPIWITRLQQLWPHPEAGAAVQAALTAHPEQSLLRRRTLPALLDLITLYEVWSALQEEATAEEPKEPIPSAAATPSAASAASTVSAIPAASAGFADSQAEVVPETEFPAIDIDLSAYSLPAGASGAIRKSGSAAQDAPSVAAADKDLPPLDFDMGSFPEAPDSGKKT
jgi:pilus assembly protein FimV